MLIRVPGYAVAAMAVAVPLTLGLYFGAGTLYRTYSDKNLYPAYLESLELDPGDVGTAPTEDTPRALSTGDFAQLDTFYTEGRLRDSCDTIDGKLYYELDLENGENVLVRVDWDATELLEPQLRRMPVGRWVELTPEQEEQVSSPYLTVTDHYVDMKGDFDRIMTAGEFSTSSTFMKILDRASLIFVLAAYLALCLAFRKRSISRRNRRAQSS